MRKPMEDNGFFQAAGNGGGEPANEAVPDFVDINGVRYYRHVDSSSPVDPLKADAPPGFTKIVINIAPYAKEIRIDNRLFIHGRAYLVPDEKVQTFLEIMQRTWAHERSTGGANMNAMVSAQNTTISRGIPQPHFGAPGVPGF
jgi:hypothetical protein